MIKGNRLRKSIKYSQNFLKDISLVKQLVDKSTLTSNDIVYEIGSGKGIITQILASKCREVVAVETDQELVEELKSRFSGKTNVKVVQGNFLNYDLPTTPYKVFSNIPFNITADLVRKLTFASIPPIDTYLIIQKEAAFKFVGSPYSKETLFSILIKPWFEASIEYKFRRNDFVPEPRVDTVLFRLRKRENPLIEDSQKQLYNDFVSYVFNRSIPNLKKGLERIFTNSQYPHLKRDFGFNQLSTPTQLTFEQWMKLFYAFVTHVDSSKKQIVFGSHSTLRKQQAGLEKIHRTRVSKNWKDENLQRTK